MTDSARRPGPVLFTEAEKLAAQREAQHAVAASGRRVAGLGVQQYLAHERCTEACSAAGHPGHHPVGAHGGTQHGRTQQRTPPDPHPRVSDLWSWLSGPPAGSRDA